MKPKILARANALTLGDKRYASTKVLSADYAHHCFYSVKEKTFKRAIEVNSTMAAAFFIACKGLEGKATAGATGRTPEIRASFPSQFRDICRPAACFEPS
jgi:hypothetical protein